MENKLYRWRSMLTNQPKDGQKVLMQYKSFDFEEKQYHAHSKDWFIRNVQCWAEPIPSQNQEEGWNAIVSRIAAADLMSKTIPGDNESVERWKKKAIDVLSKQFILIKKEQ